jgi:peptide chain release factor 1
MVPLDKLARITERYDYLEARLSAGQGDLAAQGREYADLKPVVAPIAAYRQLLGDIAEAEAMRETPRCARWPRRNCRS